MSFKKIIASFMAVASVCTVQAQSSFDPLAPAQKYAVFSPGNARLYSCQVFGPVAVGGDLAFSGSSNFASASSGNYPTGIDNHSDNYGLIVDGNLSFMGRSAMGYLSKGEARIKLALYYNYFYVDDNNITAPFRITIGSYITTPALRVDKVQTEGSANWPSGIDFPAALTQLMINSAKVDELKTGGDTARINYISIPAGNEPHITLVENKINYINLTGTEFNNLNTAGALYFDNSPSATTQVVFNLTTGPTYTCNTPKFEGVSEAAAAHILFNFLNTSSLQLNDNNTAYGHILAPFALLYHNGSAPRLGQIIAEATEITGSTINYVPASFSLPEPGTVLAITGLSFKAKAINPSLINLFWTMPDQSTISNYTLQRSYNALNFSDIHKVEKGISNTMYFSDQTEHSFQSAVYYRLKVQKTGGKLEYSDVLKVKLSDSKKQLFLSPNPAKQSITATYTATLVGVAKISIYSVNGKILQEKIVNIQKGLNTFQFDDLSRLPAGNYIMTVQINNLTMVKESFIIQ